MQIARRTRASLWNVPVGLQLGGLYVLLLALILTLLGTALYAQLDGFLTQNTAARLQQSANAILNRPAPARHKEPDNRPNDRQPQFPGPAQIPPGPASGIEGWPTDLVRGLSSPDVTVAVFDAQGQVITSTGSLISSGPVSLPTLPAGWLARVSGGVSAQLVMPREGGGRLLIVAQPLALPSDVSSAGNNGHPALVQFASLEAADSVLSQLRLYLALGVIVGTVVGIPAGLAVTRIVLRPLDRMANTAEAIAGGDLRRRLRLPHGRNEMARLGEAFDRMVGRLTATLEAQRRLVADASHELRTPLTSLYGLSEILVTGADKGDTRVVRQSAFAMHTELGRLSRLVTDLLTLSRLDSAAKAERAPVDACRVLTEVREQMTPLAEARQISLAVQCAGSLVVMSQPDQLKQVVLNLVDNALRYTPAGGEINLTGTTDPANKQVHLQIEDTGPGVSPDDLPHIFDRFYRGDPSRARATGNSGLGLSIARSIVESHGGNITAASEAGNGARFTVTLEAGAVVGAAR